MVLEGIASSLLSFFLSKYIDKVNSNDIQMSLFSGTVSLTKVNMKPTALLVHHLPFIVERGIVSKISASIPYTHLKTSPCKASIDEILILGTMCGKVLIQNDNGTNPLDISTEYSQLDKALLDQNVSKTDFTTGIIGSIIENAKAQITNIHIRLEYNVGGRTVAIGVIIPLIKVITIDDDGKEVEINTSKTAIRKKLILSNLSIYIDTKSQEFLAEVKQFNMDFRQLMLDSMKSEKHQFILHNFNFEAIYKHAKKDSGSIIYGNILNITTSAINVAFDALQFHCFKELRIEKARFDRKRFYATCSRPDDFPQSDNDKLACILWWQFFERCAQKKNNPISFKPQLALVFLRDRKLHLERLSRILLDEHQEKYKAYLLDLQNQYGGEIFLMFRAYAKYITEKNIREQMIQQSLNSSDKKRLHIDPEDIARIISHNDIIKNNADTLRIDFKIRKLNAKLFTNPTTPIALLEWDTWEGMVVKEHSDLSINANIGLMTLTNIYSKSNNTILKLVQTERTNHNCAVFKMDGNLQKHLFNIDVAIASPELDADFSFINNIRAFLSSSDNLVNVENAPKIQKRDMTTLEIQDLISIHNTIFIEMHLNSPVISIPYNKTPIRILLGNLEVKSVRPDRKRTPEDTSSWYDEYSLDLQGFSISLADKNLCKPINFSFGLMHSFIRKASIPATVINAKISCIDFTIDRNQYVLLLKFPKYILQLHNKEVHSIEFVTYNKAKQITPQQTKSLDTAASGFSIQVDLAFKQIRLQLINNIEITDAVISEISAGISAVHNTVTGRFLMQSFTIFGCDKKKICDFGNNQNTAVKLDVYLRGMEVGASLQTIPPLITVDLQWVKELINFVKKPPPTEDEKEEEQNEIIQMIQNKRKGIEQKITDISKIMKKKDLNDYQLLRKLQKHPIIKLEINIQAPKITLPFDPTDISVNLGYLRIYTLDQIERDPKNIDSFYDRFALNLTDVQIQYGNEYILEPFSTNIQICKAFITRKEVQAVKLYLDIHELIMHIKHSQFLATLAIVDAIQALNPPNPTDTNIKSQPLIPHRSKPLKSTYEPEPKDHDGTVVSALENAIKDSDDTISIYVELKFQKLNTSLLNEDNSIHSCFTINNVNSSFYSFQNNIKAHFRIEKVKGSFQNERLLSLGDEGVDSVNCSLNITKDVIGFNFNISNPTLIVDTRWIFQLNDFFKIPKKRNHHLQQDNKVPLIHQSSLPNKIELETTSQETFERQVQKLQGTFIITNPSVSMRVPDRNQQIIVINASIGEVNATVNEDKTGFFQFTDFQISVNKRYLMKPFLLKLDLQLTSGISLNLALPSILLMLKESDYQLILEIITYIPAKLFEEKERQAIHVKRTKSQRSIGQNLDNSSEEEEDKNESKKKDDDNQHHNPLLLNLHIEKVGLEISNDEKSLFNFDINGIGVNLNEKGEITVNLNSIDCKEHISSANNRLISMNNPLVVNINESQNICITIPNDATIFLKMAAVNALLEIFLPKGRILAFKPPKEKKKAILNTNTSNSSSNTINIKAECITVVFIDTYNFKTTGISFRQSGKRMKVVVQGISLIDPAVSKFHPSEMFQTGRSSAITFEMRKSALLISLNDISLFTNFSVIKKLCDDYSQHPLEINTDSSDGKEEEEDDDESGDDEEEDSNNYSTSKTERQIIFNCNNCHGLIPAKFNESDEILSALVDGRLEINSGISLRMNKFSAQFIKYNGRPHPPFIKSFSFIMTHEMNVFNLVTDPGEISFAPACIAAGNALIDSVLAFIKTLSLPQISNNKKPENEINEKRLHSKNPKDSRIITPTSNIKNHNDVDDQSKEKDHIDANAKLIQQKIENEVGPNIKLNSSSPPKQSSVVYESHDKLVIKENGDLSEESQITKLDNAIRNLSNELNFDKSANQENDNDQHSFSISIEIHSIKISLNSDRYQTLPLFTTEIQQINMVYGTNKVSKINCALRSIDYFDTVDMDWKMFVEPFALNVTLIKNLKGDEENISINASLDDPLTINLSYHAVQLLLEHSAILLEMMKSKTLCDTMPPYFKIYNKSSEKVTVKDAKSKAISAMPGETKICPFSREDEFEMSIDRVTRKIVAKTLHYPIFFNEQTVISQSLTEHGTVITITSVLQFENHTETKLYILKEKRLLRFNNVIEIEPGDVKAITSIQKLKGSKFAISTDPSALRVQHSTFTIKSIKSRAILLPCLFPDQRKMNLVVSSKFDALTCSLNVKIEPNCVIRNQLPVDLVMRAAGQKEFLYIKEGGKLKTSTIDSSHDYFYGHFAIGTFSMKTNSMSNNTNNEDKNKIKRKKLLRLEDKNANNSDNTFWVDEENNIGPVKLTERIRVTIKDGSLSPVKLTLVANSFENIDYSSITHIAIHAKIHSKKPQLNLICFSPSIIFNRSGFDFLCVNGPADKMTRMGRFSPREDNSDPTEDGFLIWSSEEYYQGVRKSRLPVRLFTTEETENRLCFQHFDNDKTRKVSEHEQNTARSSVDLKAIVGDSVIEDTNKKEIYVSDEVVNCLAVHTEGIIMIPTRKPGLFVPIQYNITSCEPFSHSTVITFTAHCRVRNMSKRSIFLQPVIPEEDTKTSATDKYKFGDLVEVRGEGIAHRIRICSVMHCFAFRSNRVSKNYVILNFTEPIHTTFELDNLLFEFEIQGMGNEMLITFKDGIFPQPINLLNDLDIGDPDIYITQKSTEDENPTKDAAWKNIAKPQSMCAVAYDTPFGPSDLILHYQNNAIPIDLVLVNASLQYDDIYYQVIVNDNNTKTIAVTKKPYEKPRQLKQLKFSAEIPVISVTLIDKEIHELALLTFEKINFIFLKGDLNDIEFKMRAFQLDDLQPSSILKVVAAGYPDLKDGETIETKNLINFKISMLPNAPMFTACKDILLEVDPIILFLDVSFLSDAIVLLRNMFLRSNSTEKYLAKPKPVEPSKLNSVPLTAESIIIKEIKFTLFVRSKTSRPMIYPSLSFLLKAIPDITNGEIVLPSFVFQHCTMNAEYIQREIIQPLIGEGISQGLKLFFNTDIFMRSTGFRSSSFAKKAEKLKNGHLEVLVQVPGSILLQTTETVVNVAAKFVHFASFDNTSKINRVNTSAKDTMLSGLKALGDGFAQGFAGLVKTPMQMNEEKGAGGAIIGIGKSLLGLVTKPIAGILDAGVASFSALLKVINGEDQDVIPPIRCAHALPMTKLQNYTLPMMAFKDVAQLAFQLSDITNLYNQWVEMYVIDAETLMWFGVTQKYVFSAYKQGGIRAKCKIKKILDIKLDPKTNIITVIADEVIIKEIVIHANNALQAFKFTQLLTSRRVALKTGD